MLLAATSNPLATLWNAIGAGSCATQTRITGVDTLTHGRSLRHGSTLRIITVVWTEDYKHRTLQAKALIATCFRRVSAAYRPGESFQDCCTKSMRELQTPWDA